MVFATYGLLKFMKKKVRIVARLDVKAPNMVKGVQMEGLRKLGNPNDFAQLYYEQGIDEILYVDIVASLYDRNSLLDIVTNTTANVFVPMIVGGGIRSIDDARKLLRAGADKVAINTAAIKNPTLIKELAETFGSQCVVVSIHAKKTSDNHWEAYYDSGREHTGMDVIEWAKQAEEYGAGELLITSVDRDGMQNGCDRELVKAITSRVAIPVIAGGGVGSKQDVVDVIQHGQPDAVAIGSALHFKKFSVGELRTELRLAGIQTRNLVN